MSVQKQNPDGSWSPAEPVPWQGGPLSVDWEVTKVHDARRGRNGWLAEGYHHADHVADVRARTRFRLNLRMRRAARRWRRTQSP